MSQPHLDIPTRRLLVMRHSKTEQAAESDHARRLTERGQSDARAAGEWLKASGHRPEMILASSAARAEETAELVANVAGVRRIELVDALYGADAYEVIDVLAKTLDDDVVNAMVVGHNPTMAELLLVLQGEGADDASFPTSAIAVFDCGDEPWSELDGGQATLLASYSPRH